MAGPHSTLELTESLRDFCRLQMLSTLQRDPKNLDLKTDLMVEFTVGGMLAVLQRWPELSDTIEIKDLLKEDVAVLAMGIYLAMSQKDMLNYWNRIFVHNAQDSTAPGMPRHPPSHRRTAPQDSPGTPLDRKPASLDCFRRTNLA